MPSRWQSFHATGGGRVAWEHGTTNEYLQSSMRGLRAEYLPTVTPSQTVGSVGMLSATPPGGPPAGSSLKAAVSGAVKSGQTAYQDRTKALQGRGIRPTPAINASAMAAGTPEPPTPDTAAYGAKSFLPQYINEVNSRMMAFHQQPTAPSVPAPTAVRPTPLRKPKAPIPGQTALF